MKTASWVIVEKTTGKAVLETYLQSVVDKINTEKYTVVPIMDYLCNLNKQTKTNQQTT